jgi:60 kDa SS-A/Ro ribonucleoprotein
MRRSLSASRRQIQYGTPQSLPARADQVQNNEGGYVFEVDKWTRLDRFMILGTEGGSYYKGQESLTREEVASASECIAEDGIRVCTIAINIIKERRASRPDYPLYILALASVDGDEETRRYVLGNLRLACNIPSFLFLFLKFRKDLGGRWNRMLRRGIAHYFNSVPDRTVMYHYLKYNQRYGYSHRDLMRLGHPAAVTKHHNDIYRFIANPEIDRSEVRELLYSPAVNPRESTDIRRLATLCNRYPILQGTLQLRYGGCTVTEAAQLIRDLKLTREMVPTEFLKRKSIWKALLKDMPLHALIRNLTNLGSHKVLTSDNEAMVDYVYRKLTDQEYIQNAGVHPMSILLASVEYARGHKEYMSGRDKRWEPVGKVKQALEQAFYNSFEYVEPTEARLLVGIDTSGSMRTPISDVPDLNICAGAALFAMSFARIEPNVDFITVDTTAKQTTIRKDETLGNLGQRFYNAALGGTNLALPMEWATQRNQVYDCIILLTDSETWHGSNGHPYEALQRYRAQINDHAKLAVIQMESNQWCLGEPEDEFVLNLVGFDPNVPKILNDFIPREYRHTHNDWGRFVKSTPFALRTFA